MCDENNLNKCGPAGLVIEKLDNAWMTYCKDNINSEDCTNFYTKKVDINGSSVQLNKDTKSRYEMNTRVDLCKSIENIESDECIKLANNNIHLQENIKQICSNADDNSKTICKNICNNPLSEKTLTDITCGINFLFIFFVILICATAIVLFLKTKKNKTKKSDNYKN